MPSSGEKYSLCVRNLISSHTMLFEMNLPVCDLLCKENEEKV